MTNSSDAASPSRSDNTMQRDVAILQSWDESSRREWLCTNGIGGYAMGSLSGACTRRYHGLLVPAFTPPLGRAVLLSKVEEDVRVEDQTYLLSAGRYPSVVNPQGFRHLTGFTTRPVPTWTFMFHEGSVVLEKRVWMAHGQNTVYVQYRLLKAPETVYFALTPLLAYKDYHSEQHKWDGFTGEITVEPDYRLKFCAYDSANPLFLHTEPGFAFTENGGWYYNIEHEREQERGLDFTEDLYCPGRWDGVLSPGQTVTLIATVETDKAAHPDAARDAELARQTELLTRAGTHGDAARETLVLAADQFVIEKSSRVSRATVIAGYPWFTDWGRDTCIALPGLCLSTGRFDTARDILSSFAGAVHNGLLPNRFADTDGAAEYNTVDASLWFFHAVHQYAEASGEWTFVVDEMRPVLEDILAHHLAGTDFGIGVDEADGLLKAGAPGVQLTWMDAKVGDWVVTPRAGKPVEINALWHNALRVASVLAERAGDTGAAASHAARADAVRVSFAAAFWNADANCLYDVINPDGTPDASLRPNQIFAVSLPFPIVEGEQAKAVVDAVQNALLTPYGLRTLAPGSSDYHAHYGPGNGAQRDGAYHQGTVWPWLVGAFVEAYLKVYGDQDAARAFLHTLTSDALMDYGVGTLSEVRDGDAPHVPNGCPAQSWSVAEVLRSLLLVS